jgi:nitric oxide reductase large subunit
MTEEDIVAGKAGFQRADLMDYGSIYGMGSYFGEDYTAQYLVELGRKTEEKIASLKLRNLLSIYQKVINTSPEKKCRRHCNTLISAMILR